MSLFQGKYRIETSRLSNWDYGSTSAYFITICTKDKEHFFGKIVDDDVTLNDIGRIVQNEWLKTPDVRPDMNLTLDEFVVMPNHFHCIINIGENKYNAAVNNEPSKFGPIAKNIGSIIRGFKSTVTKQAHQIDSAFCWQARFHDHVIRNQESYLKIRNYIINNPTNWKEDKFYSI